MRQEKFCTQAVHFTPFGEVPDDCYEVTSVVRDGDGTRILLTGERCVLMVEFGFVEALRICDEGRRIQSYHQIGDLQGYRKRNFCGNPIFRVGGDSDFSEWLKSESCGFSFRDELYAVITQNDFIDIAAAFPPKIKAENR